MSTVDEFLASGIYRDRRGRYWEACKVAECREPGEWWNYHDMARNGGRHLTITQMRLLIERDHHRDVCPRLSACNGHPVPSVLAPFEWGGRDFEVYAAWENATCTFEQSLPAAMEAARALVVKP